ncbi:uncharacterized protein OCT59_021375 [Rhizophagus irregularis]|uniref:uncharacterized protein n=1 Tax=Rhizophagus irregularis TaxID=588596 RepID=UPI0033169224|nr:hypothetical protein OCT59_021375 [Rhizophagus irregularis]
MYVVAAVAVVTVAAVVGCGGSMDCGSLDCGSLVFNYCPLTWNYLSFGLCDIRFSEVLKVHEYFSAVMGVHCKEATSELTNYFVKISRILLTDSTTVLIRISIIGTNHGVNLLFRQGCDHKH